MATRECYVAMMEMEDQVQALNIEEHRMVTEPIEKLEEITLNSSNPDRTTKIKTLANPAIRQELITFLKNNQDVFAWSHDDMLGVDPSIMVHRLNVLSSFSPVRQKKRVLALEEDQAIAKEVCKLQEASFIREVYYPDWLANVVIVKKANGEDFIRNQSRPLMLQSNAIRTEKPVATYQRLMNKMFVQQIGRNVQVYVGDILVKSRREEDHLEDLRETFGTLRSYNMKLNPGKCAFGMTTGKFLGFVKSFEWTAECQRAFEELKAYLSSPPLLSPSQLGEELFLYLAISPAVVSTALIREEDRVQKPVYYASRVLCGAKERYPPMEKLAFALVTAVCKLKPYFQVHTVNVMTDKPLRRAMNNPEAAEFTYDEDKGTEESPQCSIYTDGSSNRQAGGAGIVLLSPEGDKVECMVRLDFPTTNNEVEYEELVAGLDLTKAAGATSVVIYYDSQVVANQVNGDYECKGEKMKRYLDQVRARVDDLEAKIIQIPREENEHADRLAKTSSAEHMITPDEKEAVRKLKVQAARFVLIKDVLYKRGFSRPYLRCVGTEEADYVMREATNRRTDPDDGPMAVRSMKTRHYGNFPYSGTTAEVPGSGFGIPKVLVSNNGRQFDNDYF
ncbi:uncharacterized protein LOC115980385 [Quercus lobata]|uniref:uncharacterized protein LOC115980385 n=1 Tax=Quercus lobata TaxID=97700 RepID=UPI0012486C27|nr:uncharacterized protein LOC115980385 [Quercus lobata]